ncbi:hypothetical protein FTUN_6762 [Frigoriglobus tundricola]|uniref:Uncharacterized protein n=1 Tax=Frigoriglobus tundricola TaxID=2774151 RepID=A0A6M5Z1X9_9BACT|nr:hypothetical protein FTUN_6762 [Frigoriglobus tundricola]
MTRPLDVTRIRGFNQQPTPECSFYPGPTDFFEKTRRAVTI